jgi:hypothetical protein
LNPDWDPENGGALRVTLPHGKPLDGSGSRAHPKNVVGVSAAELEEDNAATAAAPAPASAADADAAASHSSDPFEVTVMPPTPPSSTCNANAVYSAVDIYPNAGRLAMFFSSEVPHEVLPTFADRHSLTLWYYDTAERKEAIDEAKSSGRAEKAANTSVEAQRAAKHFMEVLMGKDAEATLPLQSELEDLAARVVELSDETAGVVASVTGAPSVESFRTGFTMLTVQDLQAMRSLFRRMGLK